MNRTTELRGTCKQLLDRVQGGTFYRLAPTDTEFPYKTFDLSSINLGDLSRCDYILTVDLWDLAEDPKAVEAMADELEDEINALNVPQTGILPTFFRETRGNIEDPDKNIQHIRLSYSVQLYERGA